MSEGGAVPLPEIDVIVLDIDGGQMLQDCLASIDAQTRKAKRVIVFDNGSRVPTPNAIRSDENLGFAGGVNAALSYGDSPYVALVNNDVVLDPDWLATVAGELDGNGGVGAVQTVIRGSGNTVDGAGISIEGGVFQQIAHGQPLGQKMFPAAWGVSATAAVYRRQLLRFERHFFAYYEDAELSARMREAGWNVVVLPQDKALHRGSQSAKVLGRDALRLRARNRYWVARLHRGTVRIPALLWEDLKLLLRGRSSLRGIIQGIFGPLMKDER